MTYADYKRRMGDLIVGGQRIELAHWMALAGEDIAKPKADIWWSMFIMEHKL